MITIGVVTAQKSKETGFPYIRIESSELNAVAFKDDYYQAGNKYYVKDDDATIGTLWINAKCINIQLNSAHNNLKYVAFPIAPHVYKLMKETVNTSTIKKGA